MLCGDQAALQNEIQVEERSPWTNGPIRLAHAQLWIECRLSGRQLGALRTQAKQGPQDSRHKVTVKSVPTEQIETRRTFFKSGSQNCGLSSEEDFGDIPSTTIRCSHEAYRATQILNRSGDLH